MASINKLAYVIGFAVGRDKEGVLSFLADNLIIAASDISNPDLIALLTESFSNDPTLFDRFIVWVDDRSRTYKNAVGMSSGSGSASTGGGSSFWEGFNASAITGLLGQGVNAWAGIKASQNNMNAVNSQANIASMNASSQSQSNAMALQLAQMQLAAQQAPKQGGSNTGLYIGLGVAGVVVVGVLIYAITKK